MFWRKNKAAKGADVPPVTVANSGTLADSRSNSSIPELGRYLLQQGVLDQAKLDRALARQRELASKGRGQRLGDILVEMKYASRSQIEAAAREQREEFASGWD